MARAILLNVGVFEATNAIRRNTATYQLNYQSTSDEFQHNTIRILANGTRVVPSIENSTAVVILKTDNPLTVTVTPVEGAAFTVQVRQFFVLDQPFVSLSITAGVNGANLFIHQT